MLRRGILAACLFLAGPSRAGLSPSAGPRLPDGYLQVPLTAQATSYSCGAASLLGILRYWRAFSDKESQDETALYPVLRTTPADGTHPARLAEGARHFGLQARMREGLDWPDLEGAWRRGETVILDIQAWPERELAPEAWAANWEDGHYVVLVGTDRDFLYVMDPSTPQSYGYIPKAEFLTRWHDYEMEGGKRREYRRMGIIISGKEKLPSFPAPPERVR